jgi:hypothetical protein
MKVIHTRVITDEMTIGPRGDTPGQVVDDILNDDDPYSTVTSVTIEITEEDRVAMRLVREAQHPQVAKSKFAKPKED